MEIKSRVTMKLSQECSKSESRVLGAIYRLYEFLLKPPLQDHSGSVRKRPGKHMEKARERTKTAPRKIFTLKRGSLRGSLHKMLAQTTKITKVSFSSLIPERMRKDIAESVPFASFILNWSFPRNGMTHLLTDVNSETLLKKSQKTLLLSTILKH